jgi:uncharacterized membrane protein YfcA
MPTSFTARDALFLVLALFTVFYVVVLVGGIRRAKAGTDGGGTPTIALLLVGFVTNFFDTLGIGSFATTTSAFRQWKLVRDEVIPGTLNVGHTLPTIAQAYIYTQIVPVESKTLIFMIVAAVVGAWLGAGVVARWPRRRIQVGMGLALIGAATLLLVSKYFGTAGDLLGLEGRKLIFALGGNFMLGALMTIGIGLYAPCMILVSLLGMSAKTAFPIMMGSCAFLMPVASARFIRAGSFDAKAALGLMIGGLPAVLIAAFIVKSLPLNYVRWLVVIVVLYTAINMLRTARRESAAAALGTVPQAG